MHQSTLAILCKLGPEKQTLFGPDGPTECHIRSASLSMGSEPTGVTHTVRQDARISERYGTHGKRGCLVARHNTVSASAVVTRGQDERAHVCLGNDDLLMPVDEAIDIELF